MVANMVGTGAFTTLGLQLNFLQSGWAILGLWLLGGLLTLFGAFSYAELAVRLPPLWGRSPLFGGDFPSLAWFLSGWISLTVGFAAAVALAAMAVGKYLSAYTTWPAWLTGVLSIVLLSLAHSLSVHYSSRLQNALTVLKLLFIIGLVAAGLWLPAVADPLTDWSAQGLQQSWSPQAAVALISIFYAYSGWNAAAYIVEEIEAPARHLPRALIFGSLVVSLLFILLQYSFLRQAGGAALQGQIEVGQIAAVAMFGPSTGKLISAMIGVLLLAGISAMIWVGPRVVMAMGDRHNLWRFYGKLEANGMPLRAIWLQAGISVFLVLTASFERVLLYSGLVLQFFTFLTVLGLLKVRRAQPIAAWRSPLYPIAQWLFLGFSAWSMVYSLISFPLESLLGLLNVGAGLIAYSLDPAGLKAAD
ncbi:MAG: amino acid permease [Lewinella sp.]|nr:amino acid permease [Lewinella sp.]